MILRVDGVSSTHVMVCEMKALAVLRKEETHRGMHSSPLMGGRVHTEVRPESLYFGELERNTKCLKLSGSRMVWSRGCRVISTVAGGASPPKAPLFYESLPSHTHTGMCAVEGRGSCM